MHVLGLGTVQLGMPYGISNDVPPDDNCCIKLLHGAYELGINYIDTASAYGRSEEIVGKAFGDSDHRPLICTKITLPDSDDSNDSAQLMDTQIENSRKLLNIDALPLVKLHSLKGYFCTPFLLEYLSEKVNQGHVTNWGVTTYGSIAPLQALEYPSLFSSIQLPFNILDRELFNNLQSHKNSYNVTFVARSIFLQGLLTGRFNSIPQKLTSLQPTITSLKLISNRFGFSLAELCLRYSAYYSGINVALFGTQNWKEITNNVGYFNAGPLPIEVIKELEMIKIQDKSLLDPSTWED